MGNEIKKLIVILALFLVMMGFVAPARAAAPALFIEQPSDGAVIDGPNITLSFRAEGWLFVKSEVPVASVAQRPEINRAGEGHLRITLDLRSAVMWDSADPYILTDVAPGSHQIWVEVVNNDNSSLTPPILQQINFSTTANLPVTGAGQDATGATTVFIMLLALALASTGVIMRRTQRG